MVRGALVVFVSSACLLACEARLVVGSTCTRDSDCPSELVCDLNRCREECVEQRDCRLGARCVVEPSSGLGRCSLPDDPDCRTAGNECHTGLLCVGRACVNACETTASCPSGSICVPDEMGRAYCERADIDASFPDASVPEADAPDDAPPEALDAPETDAPGDAGPCEGGACDEPVSVAVIPSASCALLASGAIWCWGHGVFVGDGGTHPMCKDGPCADSPVRVRTDAGGPLRDVDGAARLTGGRVFSALLGGRAISWGSGFPTAATMGGGEIARAIRVGPSGAAFLPATVEEIEQGFTSAFASLTDGTLYAWGENDYAQFGAPGPGSDWAVVVTGVPARPLPRLGGWHGCTIGGTPPRVSCWGENDVGQAGGPPPYGPGATVTTPTVVAGIPDGATVVVPGRSQTCALIAGEVWCWGAPYAIGTGAEPAGCRTDGGLRGCPPTRVTWAGGAFTQLFGGPYAEDVCATDGAGELYCWGAIGTGEPTHFDLPAPVTDVALGDLHSCAIADGEIWCWGSNVYGQLGRAWTTSTAEPPGVVVFP